MKPSVKVTGLKEAMQALRKLPGKPAKKVLKSATSKGATPVAKAGRKLAPLGDGLNPDGSPREHLRKTIGKSSAKSYGNTVVVVVGPKFKAAPHAKIVDDGAKPHDIVLTQSWGNVAAGTTIHHPGAKASRFMERAGEQAGPAAAKAMEKGIATGIEKEAKKLAGKR